MYIYIYIYIYICTYMYLYINTYKRTYIYMYQNVLSTGMWACILLLQRRQHTSLWYQTPFLHQVHLQSCVHVRLWAMRICARKSHVSNMVKTHTIFTYIHTSRWTSLQGITAWCTRTCMCVRVCMSAFSRMARSMFVQHFATVSTPPLQDTVPSWKASTEQPSLLSRGRRLPEKERQGNKIGFRRLKKISAASQYTKIG